jgi:hypothetical protein
VKGRSTKRNQRRESGVALLIAIFVLLLISVVGIALIVSSGTESALAGNYRSATGVYYASVAGLEEARGRLLAKNPNSFLKTAPANFLPPPGTQWDIGYVSYVLNPGPADAADTRTAYPDTEYDNEFGNGKLAAANTAGTVATTPSVWNVAPLNALPVPGPLYKWVRINAVSEVSLQRQVAPFDGHTADPTKPIYYDGTLLTVTSAGAQQVLEITALAVLPNGTQNASQKLVQYLIAPTPLNLSFQAALTLDGNTPRFTASPSPFFWVDGNDNGAVGTCNPTAAPVAAVGYTAGSLSNFVRPGNPAGIPVGPPSTADLRNHYTPFVSPNPDIVSVSALLPANLQTVAGLNALVQTIEQNADVVVNGNATGANMPAAMSPTNPMTIVINGDLVFSGWRQTGYGLLLVTGEFTYDPDASWDGIILVIGKGWMYSHQSAYTNTQIQGAVFLARTLDASGNPLPPSSAPIFTAASSGFDFHSTPNTLTNGIYYSNCWIQASMPTLPYKTLSFHEISQ